MASTQNRIVHKRSDVPGHRPTAAQLLFGEFAVNYADGRVFLRRTDGAVLDITAPLYRIDGGRLVGTGGLRGVLTENGDVLYTENFQRLVLG